MVIIKAEDYTDELLREIAIFHIQVYGYKNFTDEIYPAKSKSDAQIAEMIKNEKYIQIEFDFYDNDVTSNLTRGDYYTKYCEIKDIFNKLGIKIVNQMKGKPE